MKDINKVKLNIITNVYLFIDTNDSKYSEDALKALKELASIYHVTTRKTMKLPLKPTFKQFILNKEGYQVTINKLYNAL